jgi:hypothetical protein
MIPTNCFVKRMYICVNFEHGCDWQFKGPVRKKDRNQKRPDYGLVFFNSLSLLKIVKLQKTGLNQLRPVLSWELTLYSTYNAVNLIPGSSKMVEN